MGYFSVLVDKVNTANRSLKIIIIPSDVYACTVSFLICRNNFLTTLPTEIGELTTLGTFDLHSNKV